MADSVREVEVGMGVWVVVIVLFSENENEDWVAVVDVLLWVEGSGMAVGCAQAQTEATRVLQHPKPRPIEKQERMDDPPSNNDDESDTDLPSPDSIVASSSSSVSARTPSQQHPIKKRRRTSPSSTKPLFKPFRTPLKPSSASGTNAGVYPSSPLKETTPTSTTSPIRPPPRPPSATLTTPVIPQPTPIPLSKNTPTTLSDLRKTHTHHLTTLLSLRSKLATTTQALEIETSSSSADLEVLIRRWRKVSQEAADEVFGIMRGRVEGVGRWKKIGDESSGGGGVGEVMGKGGGDGGGEEEEEDDNEEEAFTMERMLQTLGIPLMKIGYDSELQSWTDV
ncbi:MAG: hypothetical protein Q9220_005235 [cf. Caloplaca sp. 1 TL-2023]